MTDLFLEGPRPVSVGRSIFVTVIVRYDVLCGDCREQGNQPSQPGIKQPALCCLHTIPPSLHHISKVKAANKY